VRVGCWAILCLSCSVIDSVDDYAGPPRSPADAGVALDADSGGFGGSELDATSGCKDASDCDDDSPCTIDSCFGNLCHHEADVSASCDDGNPCNGNEFCTTEGECFEGDPPELDDENECTVDSCNPNAGGVVHDPVPYPDIKVCGGANCPNGYYRAQYLICDTDCGGPNNCGFCINGTLCRKLCKKTHVVCCTGDGCNVSCPSGYSAGATSCSNGCGCNTCGSNVTCTRK
jgi:hypothetical protein